MQGSYFSSDKVLDLEAGQLYSLQVKFAKKLGSTKFKLLWESNSQGFGVISKEHLYNLQNSESTPYLFTVLPAQSSKTTSLFASLAQVQTATVNTAESHLWTARDSFSNLKQDTLDLLVVKLTH